MVDEERPAVAAGSTPPTSASDDDVTAEAGKKYFLLVFTFAVLFWIVAWGYYKQWWTSPVPGFGATLLSAVIGLISKLEEKRLKAARFSRRANVVSLGYVSVLTVLAVVIVLWGSPLGSRIGALFGSASPSTSTSAGDTPAPPAPITGQQDEPGCQDPAVSFPTAWGPDRPLVSDRPLTTAGPFSSQPTFNNALLKGAPGESDEDMRSRMIAARPSVLINPGGFMTDLQAVPDEEYRVRVSVVNTGSRTIAGTTALDSRVRIALPQCPSPTVHMVGVATSSNAVPGTVWATTTFTASSPFRLIPSGRPAKICPKLACRSNADFTTFTAEADLYGPEGALLGTNPASPDGALPGLVAVDLLVYLKAVF